MREKFTAYMDGIDFQEEQGRPVQGNPIYATPEAVLKHRTCAEECGVVEVEVSLVRWVCSQTPPHLSSGEVTEHVSARDEDQRQPDQEMVDEIGDVVDEIWGKPKEASVEILADWLTERRMKEEQGK